MVKQQNKASEFTLKKRQVEAIINAAASFRDRVLIKLLYQTGLRRGEVAINRGSKAQPLDIRDVTLPQDPGEIGHVTIRGKGSKERTIPIPPDLVAELRFLIGPRKVGPVFLSQKGDDEPLSVSQVNRIIGKCAQRAGVKSPNPRRKNVNPHIFRHTFARDFLATQGDQHILKLQHILGHSSIVTTAGTYGTPSQAQLDQAAASLWEKRKEREEHGGQG